MKVLVFGGRYYGVRPNPDHYRYDPEGFRLASLKAGFEESTLCNTLHEYHDRYTITCVIHGKATGADTLAGQWARKNGIREWAFPANWKAQGKAAGMIRNAQMLKEAKPDMAVEFPGGNGTLHMHGLCMKQGLKLRVVCASEIDTLVKEHTNGHGA